MCWSEGVRIALYALVEGGCENLGSSLVVTHGEDLGNFLAGKGGSVLDFLFDLCCDVCGRLYGNFSCLLFADVFFSFGHKIAVF